MQNRGARYNSLEDLERDFESQLNRVDDPIEKAEVRVKLAEAKVDYRKQEAQGRMVDAWRRLAMVEYPGAAKFPELVQGGTEEELRESAKAVAERVAGLANQTAGQDSFDRLRDQARDYYGRSGGPGGSGPPSAYTPPNMTEERWAQDFAERFNSAPKDMYGTRQGIASQDVDRYARQRMVNNVMDRIRFWGQMTRGGA